MSPVIDHRQIATLLAALRHWQSSGMATSSASSIGLQNIASDCGNVEPLDAKEIEKLYEALSSKEFRAECYRPKVAVLHDAGELGVLSDPEVEVERIATDNVHALVTEHRDELFNILGEKFERLTTVIR